MCIFDLNRFSTGLQLPGREAACWDHFLSCRDLIKIGALPESYAYTGMLTGILFLLFLSGVFAFKKNWKAAHMSLLIVIVWKFIWFLGIFNYGTSNFEYFHLIPSLVFLFSRGKLSNIRFIWAFLYFLCSFVKLDASWIVGTYFSPLKLGLPLFADSLIPFVTNFVILFEMSFSLALLSNNKRIANTSLIVWTFFHFYSGILLGYYYPVRCLLFLWVIFGFPHQGELKNPGLPKFRWGMAGLVVYLLFANFAGTLISKDPFETHEGVVYGFHMINSNYQCLNKIDSKNLDGTPLASYEFGSTAPMTRCSPDRTLQRLQETCKKKEQIIHWRLYQSRNGSPFFEIVNTENACNLTYIPFRHNDWILTPSSGAPLIGYPDKNAIYSEGTGALPKIYETPRLFLSGTQEWLTKSYEGLKLIYGFLWALLLLAFIRQGFFPSKGIQKQ